VLRRCGYRVLEASGGEEAMSMSREHGAAIDLLVTDVVMPQMSGRELADRLRDLRPRMRVLFVSGHTDDSVLRHGVVAEGVAFLQKPVTPDLIARKVRDVLERGA
jgi:CheY-like chemotaxis protein